VEDLCSNSLQTLLIVMPLSCEQSEQFRFAPSRDARVLFHLQLYQLLDQSQQSLTVAHGVIASNPDA